MDLGTSILEKIEEEGGGGGGGAFMRPGGAMRRENEMLQELSENEMLGRIILIYRS